MTTIKDRINAFGRDFRDVPVTYKTLLVGTLTLLFAFQIAYFGQKSFGTNVLIVYFFITGISITMVGLGSLIAARWNDRKPI